MPLSLEQLAAGFVACTLPRAEWTHHAHLRVGLWHLLRYSPKESLTLLRQRICALNESHGVANSETGGYHESITHFYVRQIASFLAVRGDASGQAVASGTADELTDELVALHGAKDLPLRYWSKALLMSPEARLGWVEPDLLSPPWVRLD